MICRIVIIFICTVQFVEFFVLSLRENKVQIESRYLWEEKQTHSSNTVAIEIKTMVTAYVIAGILY